MQIKHTNYSRGSIGYFTLAIMSEEEKIKVAQRRCVDITQLNLKREEITDMYDKWAREYDSVSTKLA